MEGKKMCQLICGNVVAEMEGKKKKKNCGYGVVENWRRERERERERERIV